MANRNSAIKFSINQCSCSKIVFLGHWPLFSHFKTSWFFKAQLWRPFSLEVSTHFNHTLSQYWVGNRRPSSYLCWWWQYLLFSLDSWGWKVWRFNITDHDSIVQENSFTNTDHYENLNCFMFIWFKNTWIYTQT